MEHQNNFLNDNQEPSDNEKISNNDIRIVPNSQIFNKSNSEQIKVNFYRALIIFILGWIGLSIIYSIVVDVGKSFGYVIDYVNDPTNSYIINSNYQLIAYGILFVTLIIAVLAPAFKENFKKIIQGYNKIETYAKGLIFAVILLAWQIIYGLITTAIFGDISSNANQVSLTVLFKHNPVAIFLVAVFLAPICEEFTYRYALFGGIRSLGANNKYNKLFTILAFVLTALIFGLIHFDFDAFTTGGDALKIELINLPNYIGAGLILCYAYYHSESLITSILVHFINNLYSIIGMLIAMSGGN